MANELATVNAAMAAANGGTMRAVLAAVEGSPAHVQELVMKALGVHCSHEMSVAPAGATFPVTVTVSQATFDQMVAQGVISSAGDLLHLPPTFAARVIFVAA